jgi:hypothetical protein
VLHGVAEQLRHHDAGLVDHLWSHSDAVQVGHQSAAGSGHSREPVNDAKGAVAGRDTLGGLRHENALLYL